MYTYSLTSGTSILRSDGAHIPADPLNSDYAAYLAWAAAGNTATGIPLATLQAQQIATLSAACAAAIYAGFTSSALGATYLYPFQDKDQANLNGEVSMSLLPAGQAPGWTTQFWCADSNGVWAMRSHTAAQIQQVGQDAAAAKLANVQKNVSFAAQVKAATSPAAVSAVMWS